MTAATQPSAADHQEPSEEAQALITGARYGDVKDVTMALDAGVSVDAVDSRGCTGAEIHQRHACAFSTALVAPSVRMLRACLIRRFDRDCNYHLFRRATMSIVTTHVLIPGKHACIRLTVCGHCLLGTLYVQTHA